MTTPEYAGEYERALHYEADDATVHHFLTELAKPEHNETRWGTGGDQTMRSVAADAFSDVGREREGELLRGGGHVVVHEGKVKPGRFTHKHVWNAAAETVDHMDGWAGYDHATRLDSEDVGNQVVNAEHHDPYDIPEHTHYPYGTFRVHQFSDQHDIYPTHVHATELPSYLADVYNDDVSRADYGWNTDDDPHDTLEHNAAEFDRLLDRLRKAPVEEPAE